MLNESDDADIRWVMRVAFDSLYIQEMTDPELAFPNDEVSQLIAFLREDWGIPVEELSQFVEWSEQKVTIRTDVLDNLSTVSEWILLHTIPTYMLIKRETAR
jgi:hypothetical protein